MRGTPRARMAAGAAVLALALAACGGGDEETPSEEGGATTGGNVSVEISEPQFLTPANTNDTSGSQVLAALFTGLVEFEPETNKPILSDLAEAVESSDNQNWTIKIKEGYTFHDGTPVTADSFIGAWNYAAYAPAAMQNNYFFSDVAGYCDLNPGGEGAGGTCPGDVTATPTVTEMSGLKKVSDTEFTVELVQPGLTYFAKLGYTAFYPMPAAFLDADDAGKTAFQEAPVGNGPFQMDGTWTHDQSIKVTKYADYTGTQPNIDSAEFKIYSSLDTAFADSQAGNLDVNYNLPPTQLATAQAEFGDRYVESPSSNYAFVGFPVTDKEFQNPDIRKAISMAIDREAITETIYSGTRKPATDFVNPVVAGYRDGACGDPCTYDPEAAKAMFDAAGGIPDGNMTITYNADGGHKDWVDAACNNIKANLGIDCLGVAKDKFATLLDDLDASKADPNASFGPFRLGWIMDYPSMQNYLGPLYSSNGSSNYYGYANPEFDKLVNEGNAQATEEEAIAIWQQAGDILAEDFPAMPMWNAVQPAVWTERVTNVNFDPFNKVDLVAIEVVE